MIDPSIRPTWMAVLAKAQIQDLEEAWASLRDQPEYEFLRPPEIGLFMIQARVGGNGGPFHLGEVTVTRCTLRLKKGQQGTAYVMGHNPRHAELAALFDALLQDPARHHFLMEGLIEPLKRKNQMRRAELAERAARTKVEFFTLARGEDS